MTVDDLKAVMRFQMTNLSTTGNDITDDSVHGTELSDAGVGTATPRRIYKSFIRFTLVNNGHADKPWPSNWLELTIAELAPKLLS